MVTNAIRLFCDQANLTPDEEVKCGNFTSLVRDKCFPILRADWKKIFEEENREEVLDKLDESNAYFLHIWSSMENFDGKKYKLKFDSESAYMTLAKTRCPKVYETLEKYF